MAMVFPRCLKYFSILIVIFAILYTYEIPHNPSKTNTLLLTKTATLQYNRTHVFKAITNINKYTVWYPNVQRVEYIKDVSARVKSEKYRLITKFPIIGDVASSLFILKTDRPKLFVYSVDSWLLEINSIELKDNVTNMNSTRIEWNVYTKRRSILFQCILLPFARFYKNQIVREALFTLIMQIRDL